MKKLLAAVLAVSASLPALAAPPGSADGPAVYKKNCAACHGADGKGTPTGPAIAGKSAKTVATIVNAHPPPMNAIQLTPDETAAVGRYVSSLKK
jgi:mono/diheme cytochrome c family protein